MPPSWMWHLDHELEEWFRRVDDDRRNRYSGDRDDREQVPLMRNELAEEYRRQRRAG